MIILISGNSCTGKTYMAQQLLERYHVPYLSIDHAVPYFEIKENYEEEISKVYDYIEGEKQKIESGNR